MATIERKSMFNQIKKISKFTPKEKIDDMLGYSLFQIETLPVYYYGNGFFVAYTSKKFQVECNVRMEYGEEGMYAVSVYHFADVEMLKANFGLKSFDETDVKYVTCEFIEGGVAYGQTFKDIQKMRLKDRFSNSYMEGKRRRLVDGKMSVINLFITCGSYTFFFYGKSPNSLLSGFEYVLNE